MSDRIEILESQGRKWVVFGISICMVSGSLYVLVTNTEPMFDVFAICTTLWFGYLSFRMFSIAKDTRPSMILDENGITNRDGRVGLIEWQDIQYASLQQFKGQTYLHLHINDEEKYRSRLGHKSNTIRILRKALGPSPFIIPTVTLQMSPRRLLALINERIDPYPFD